MSLSEALLAVAELAGQWMLWLLIGLSIVSFAVMLERSWFFWRRRLNGDELGKQIFYMFRGGDLAKARTALLRHNAPECLVLAAGLTKADEGAAPVAAAMQSARQRERIRLQCNLGLLAAVAKSAPWIGLLGTLLDLISLFDRLSHASPDELGLTGPLLAGISQALVSTAVGVVVAVPAAVASSLFDRRVRSTLSQSDSLAQLVLSQIPQWVAAREKLADAAAKAA
jgi:biopolymer transport protein ExbB